MYGNREQLKLTKFTKFIKVSSVTDELQSESEHLLQAEASLLDSQFLSLESDSQVPNPALCLKRVVIVGI